MCSSAKGLYYCRLVLPNKMSTKYLTKRTVISCCSASQDVGSLLARDWMLDHPDTKVVVHYTIPVP